MPIYGWGNSISSITTVCSILDLKTCPRLTNSRGAIPRGLGRSYGDSALNSGGLAIEHLNNSGIAIDEQLGIATVDGGLSIAKLESEALKKGFFPPVVPGTGKVTIGGAIASDIHGKSHHKVGSFGTHVLEIELMLADGSLMVLGPDGPSNDLFWATVGGMGLTGFIMKAKIKLIRVESSFVKVHEERAGNLDEVLNKLIEFDSKFTYTVAWIDISGKFQGRGVVSGANHAKATEVKGTKLKRHRKLDENKYFNLPYSHSFNLVNQFSISLFNKFWFHKRHTRKIQDIQKFMHPLDGIANWNNLYGVNGFIQYQFVIPFDSVHFMKLVLNKLQEANCTSGLTVLKRLGKEHGGMLSFPKSGWTLAVDFPIGNPQLSRVLSELDDLLVAFGGRLYLTKDSRMNGDLLPKMYERIDEWRAIKRKYDPDNYWQSDQSRRLKLC